jgi:peptidoglycan/xylan/chitin deacetylase (PgdA/CDA1 family)
MLDQLPSHGRYDYSGISERPRFTWPGGARVALYVACALEHYAFGEGMAEDLVPGGSHPDVLNTSWREYGNRVAAWRLLDLFAEHRLAAGILLNSAVCDHAPSLVAACNAAGHELIAHGHSNSQTLAGMTDAQQAAYVSAVAERMARAGQTPRGWAGPWMAETLTTPDVLAEQGYGYILDWCMDDQPVWMNTRSGPLLSVPYSQEINDSAAIIGRQVSAADFADMIVDQFEEMLATAKDGHPVVMSVILHAFIIGQPFRMRHLRRALDHILAPRAEVWITRPGDIAEHFRTLPGAIA